MSNRILRVIVTLMIAGSLPVVGAARTKSDRISSPRKLLLHVSATRDVPVVMLQRAQRAVLSIFAQIGVRVDWVGCGLDRRDPETLVIAPTVPISVAVVSRETRALDAIPPGVLGAGLPATRDAR